MLTLFPKQSLLYGVLAPLYAGESIIRIRRLRTGAPNDSRTHFVDIDVFYAPYYCSAEVTRPRALQP